MRILYICIAGFLISSGSISCQSAYEMEDKAWSCMKANFNTLSIDLDAELAAYETFLVVEGYMTNTTAQGYMAIIDTIEARNDLSPPPIKEDYMEKLQRFAKSGKRMPCLTPEEIKKTKIPVFQAEAEKVWGKAIDINPRLIATIMKKVYEERDFEHPFYRFSMISNLALFVTRDKGISRQLPPPPSAQNETPLAPRNIIKLNLDENDELQLNGEPIELKELKKELLVLLKGSNSNIELPELTIREIDLLGTVEISKAVISFSTDRRAQYKSYIAVQNEVVAAYNMLRDKASQQYFSGPYDSLTEEQQKAIQTLIPRRLSEAPSN